MELDASFLEPAQAFQAHDEAQPLMVFLGDVKTCPPAFGRSVRQEEVGRAAA